MLPWWIAFALLWAMTVLVTALNRAARAGRSPAPTGERKSTIVLGAGHGVSMLAGLVFPWLRLGETRWPASVAWLAIAFMLGGMALQVWAMRTLGPHFTLSLGAGADQPLIARGPYRWIRHPGYLGQAVFWLAFAVACRNAITLAVILAADGVGYAFRIRAEERVLLDAWGDRYRRYRERTGALLPRLRAR